MPRAVPALVVSTLALLLLSAHPAHAGRRRGPSLPPDILISSPAQGSFTTGTSVVVTGRVQGVSLSNHTLFLNGIAATLDSQGFFSETVALDPTRIFQPIVGILRSDRYGNIRKRVQRTVILGDSIGDGDYSFESIGLRLNDTGLDQLEPVIAGLVDLDLATLLPPGTLIIDDFEYFCLIFCLTTDVVVNPTGGSNAPPPSISSFQIGVDAMASGSVRGVITLNDMFVSARATALGCDIDVDAATSTIEGDFALGADSGTPTQLDVTQLGDVMVGFGSFSHATDCGSGFGSGLLELLVDLLIGDVESLVEDAFVGFLGTVPAGDDDPPIAAAIEDALAGIDIAGPIGESLGVHMDTPIFDVPTDAEGLTIGNDAAITSNLGTGPGQCDAPPGVPDLAGSWHVQEAFPVFGPTTPERGLPYQIGLCISTSAFNQLLKAETECGLLVEDLTELGGIPLTTPVLASVFPELAGRWPSPLPARLEVRPQLAPVLSGSSGPQGELAELHLGHLVVQLIVENGGEDELVFTGVVGIRAGLDLLFDNVANSLAFHLGSLDPADLSIVLLENPFQLNEFNVVNVLSELLPAALPTVAESLGSFPLPSFLGLELYSVEVSRSSEFMSLFADLVPPGTVLRHDYTGADFQSPNLTLMGDAAWVTDSDPLFAPFPDRLRLTGNGNGLLGSAWFGLHTIDPSQSWNTVYRFQISHPVAGGADGLGFHIQGDGLGANPDHEGNGLSTPYLSVAIDTWNNGPEGSEESLKVILNGTQVYFNDLLDFGPDPNPGSSANVFRMELGYEAASQLLHIQLFDEGGPDQLEDTVSLDLSGFGPSLAGFSGITGAATEYHDIRSWQLSAAVP